VADDLGAMKEPAPSQRRSEGKGRAPVDETRSTGSATNGLADRHSRDDQPPPAWRVLLAYARPYRLTLAVGGLLSLATGAVGLVLPLTVKRLVDDLAQDRSVTEALVLLAARWAAMCWSGPPSRWSWTPDAAWRTTLHSLTHTTVVPT
jgi:hypothetical protein